MAPSRRGRAGREDPPAPDPPASQAPPATGTFPPVRPRPRRESALPRACLVWPSWPLFTCYKNSPNPIPLSQAPSPATEDRSWSAVPQLACWLELILEILFNESFLVCYIVPQK